MVRSVDEWIGKTDDHTPPATVRLRVFDRYKGHCYRCGHKIVAGERWDCDHVKALINGGENREKNLAPLCFMCIPVKNAEDVAEKSDRFEKRSRHLGVKEPSRGFWRPPGSKFNWRTKRYERPTSEEDRTAQDSSEGRMRRDG
jgi:hypothetical protein